MSLFSVARHVAYEAFDGAAEGSLGVVPSPFEDSLVVICDFSLEHLAHVLHGPPPSGGNDLAHLCRGELNERISI